MLRKKKKVLVVDDDPDTLLVYEKTLSAAGFKVLKAMNGKQSLEEARKNRPDIIIMDIMMPEADGISSILKLKGDDRTSAIPVVVATSVEEMEDRTVADSLGVAGYFVKRANMDQIITKIEEILEENDRQQS